MTEPVGIGQEPDHNVAKPLVKPKRVTRSLLDSGRGGEDIQENVASKQIRAAVCIILAQPDREDSGGLGLGFQVCNKFRADAVALVGRIDNQRMQFPGV